MSRFVLLVLALTLTSVSMPARAQSVGERTAVHGFAGWSYARTDADNRYLGGDSEGQYRNTHFALGVSSELNDRLRINGQVWWLDMASEEGLIVELDWIFAEWIVTDALRVRMGRAKQPFGIYTETFDVGTLRPFYYLPQGIYGPSGFLGEAFDGLGITGGTYGATGWGLEYDLYGGGLVIEEEQPWEELEAADPTAEGGEAEELLGDLVGGRVTLVMPIAGLRLGASGFSGVEKTADIDVRRSVVGGFLQYLGGRVTFNAEAAHVSKEGELASNAAYAEAAYRFPVGFELAARFDWSDTDPEEPVDAEALSLLRHKSVELGLNYWVTGNFVIKASYHYVDGNRFASPEDLTTAVAANALEPRTHLVLVGTQFSF